nr:lysine exporter LysO family protein [uncultured Holophaga sp.]
MSMGILLLFLLAGGVSGWLLRERSGFLTRVRTLTQYCLWALLFLMGARLAQARAVFSREPQVLLWAVGSTLLLALVMATIFSLLRVLGLVSGRGPAAEGPTSAHGSHPFRTVLVNGAWLAGGWIALLLAVRVSGSSPSLTAATTGLLDLLLLLIGFDLGAESHRLEWRDLGPSALAAPFLNILLSLLCGMLFARLRGMPLREGLLLYSGLGWYSLAPVMIASHGLALLSALAFIHNLFRELVAILTAPLAARLSPHLPIYLGGATTMDVMLPFVQRYSGRNCTLASFFSGLVCSLAVAPLVRLFLG